MNSSKNAFINLSYLTKEFMVGECYKQYMLVYNLIIFEFHSVVIIENTVQFSYKSHESLVVTNRQTVMPVITFS